MAKLSKKIEKLRAILTSKKQVEESIANIDQIGEFTEDDATLMESFKRIFHKGTTQLTKFLSDLDEKGSKLIEAEDEYSIIYYVRQLLVSPFGVITRSLTNGKKFWKLSPDIMGVNSNLNRSNIQKPILEAPGEGEIVLNDSINTLTKVPGFMLKNINELNSLNTNMMIYSYQAPISLDNYFSDRLDDYNPNNFTSHGSFFISDTHSFENTQLASSLIQESLSSYLGDEDYKLYAWKKSYNPFNSEHNINSTSNVPVERVVIKDLTYINESTTEDPNTEIFVEQNPAPNPVLDVLKPISIYTDLGGRVFESPEVRKNKVKLPLLKTPVELNLHTIEGQLGPVKELND